MKTQRLNLSLWTSIFICFFALSVRAQKASVEGISTDSDTTISIRKGDAKTMTEYQIVDNQAAVEGDSSVLTKEAKSNWKKACDDWKKEIKDLNKENQILALNCNAPKCSAEKGETICRSQATYQIKVKMRH